MSVKFDLLKSSRLILKVLIALNVLAGVLSFVTGVLTIPFEARIFVEIAMNPNIVDPESFVPLLRKLAFISAIISVGIHFALLQLWRIVGSVRNGLPFILENARRLQIAAWATLTVQLGDLLIAHIVLTYAMRTGDNIAIGVSFAGWLAVLMLFVLARIFTVGAAMQDELDATV